MTDLGPLAIRDVRIKGEEEIRKRKNVAPNSSSIASANPAMREARRNPVWVLICIIFIVLLFGIAWLIY